MDKINTKPVLNFKAMTAVLAADPDGLAILGAWNCMELLAREDPEGCVRLDPCQPMDIPMLAGLFHCAVHIVEKAVNLFRKMNRLTVKDGVIRIGSCVTGTRLDAGDDAGVVRTDVTALQTDAVRANTARIDADAERGDVARVTADAEREEADAERERLNLLNRLRVRRCRAKKKQEKMRAMAGKTEIAMPCGTEAAAVPPVGVGYGNGAVMDVMEDVMQPVMDVTGRGEKRKKQRKENINNNNLNNPKYPDKHISIYGSQEEKEKNGGPLQTETDGAGSSLPLAAENGDAGSCLPFVPESNRSMVSLETLSGPCRNVLEAWNKLPLKKFTGLIPSFLKKLNVLLARYGETAVRQAVEGIGRSSFLLGKKGGWIVTLGWLLKPGNFAKVLSGKYQDWDGGSNGYMDWNNGGSSYMNRNNGSSGSNGYADWNNGGSSYMGRNNGGSGCPQRQNRFPFYLPGEGDEPLDEEKTKQGLYEFFHPNDPTRKKVAGLLGLTQ